MAVLKHSMSGIFYLCLILLEFSEVVAGTSDERLACTGALCLHCVQIHSETALIYRAPAGIITRAGLEDKRCYSGATPVGLRLPAGIQVYLASFGVSRGTGTQVKEQYKEHVFCG